MCDRPYVCLPLQVFVPTCLSLCVSVCLFVDCLSFYLCVSLLLSFRLGPLSGGIGARRWRESQLRAEKRHSRQRNGQLLNCHSRTRTRLSWLDNRRGVGLLGSFVARSLFFFFIHFFKKFLIYFLIHSIA